MYFKKEDVWLSIGDNGTWQNGIMLHSMQEKALMNIYIYIYIYIYKTIGNVLHYFIWFFPTKNENNICFINCQSCKGGHLSRNYISVIQNLGNLDFLSTTIVVRLLSRKTSVVHIFNPTLQGYSCTHQELMSSHIHFFSYSYHQKVVIGRFVNL